MPFRAVAFDFDGLLVNTEELYHEVSQALLARRGRTLDADLVAAMRGRTNLAALQLMIDWHELVDTVEALLAETDALFEPLLSTRLAPMPGAADLLDRLRAAGVLQAVVTSGRRGFVLPILSRFGWNDGFAFILSGEDVTIGKPDPEPYREAARRLGVSPGEMLVLEDSHHGCVSGVAAGCGVVYVPTDRFAAAIPGVLAVVDSLADPRITELMGIDYTPRGQK